MGALKVRTGPSTWATVVGQPGPAGPPGPPGDPVWVGTEEPSDPDYDLWLDTDEPAVSIMLPTYPIATGASVAEINGIISAHPSGVILELQSGTYTITDTPILLSSKTSLICEGTAIFNVTPSGGLAQAIFGGGVAGAYANFTVNQAAGSFTVTLPTGMGSSFGVDDVIELRSEVVVSQAPAPHGDAFARELHQVLGIAGDVLTLDGPLEFAYNTANTAKFAKHTPITDVRIKGVTIHMTQADPTVYALNLNRCLRGEIDVTVVNGSAVTVADAISTKVAVVCDGSKNYDDPLGYGVSVVGSGRGAKIDVQGRACRHLFTTSPIFFSTQAYTGPFSTEVRGYGTGGPESSAIFDTHPHAYDTKFVGCHGDGPGQTSYYTFSDRGHRTKFIGCTGQGAARGLQLNDSSRDAIVTDCDFTGTTHGMVDNGQNATVISSRIKGPIGILLASAHIAGIYAGNEIITTTTGVDDDSANPATLFANNIFRLAGGTGFTDYAGMAKNSQLAPGSTGTLLGVLAASARWEDPTEVRLPLSSFVAAVATPTLESIGTIQVAGWKFDPTTAEQANCAVERASILPGWQTYDVDVLWGQFGAASAGGVFWSWYAGSFEPGTVVTPVLIQSNVGTSPGTSITPVRTTIATAVPVSVDDFLSVGLRRLATHASDTLTVDAVVFAIVLRRVT